MTGAGKCDAQLQEGWEGGSRELQACQSDLDARDGYEADHPECHHTACVTPPIKRVVPRQPGFVKHRSCLINLISFYDKLTHVVNVGNAVDVVYLDLSKAFGTISHIVFHGVNGWTA